MAPLAPSAVALACVPGLEGDAGALRVEPLEGGSVNDVYRVDTSLGRFVLRVDGPAWRRPGVDRAREMQLCRPAIGAGLAPRIHAWHPDIGVLVTSFIEGRTWCDADAVPASLHTLGETLAKLHALPVPDVAAFDPVPLAIAYAAEARGHGVDARLLDEVARQLSESWSRVQQRGLDTCIVHGDLTSGNLLWEVLGARQRLWLLDWEYAQRSDPLLDPACILAYRPELWSMRVQLLASAGLGNTRAADLAAAVHVHQALGWFWHGARGERRPAPTVPS